MDTRRYRVQPTCPLIHMANGSKLNLCGQRVVIVGPHRLEDVRAGKEPFAVVVWVPNGPGNMAIKAEHLKKEGR